MARKNGTKSKINAKAEPQFPARSEIPLSDLADTSSDVGADPANTAAAQDTTTTALTPAGNQQSLMASAAQLAEFKRTWGFNKARIEAWAKKKPKQIATLKRGTNNLTEFFANNAMYRAETLRLFEKWASLTLDDVRTDQMGKLLDLLYGRWGGHRNVGKVKKSIGNMGKEKEEEAETGEYEREDEANLVPVETVKRTSDDNRTTQPNDHPLDDEEYSQDARIRILREIS